MKPSIIKWSIILLTLSVVALSVCTLTMYCDLRQYREIGIELTTKAKTADFFYHKYRSIIKGQNNKYNDEHGMMYLGIAAHMGHDDAQGHLAYHLGNQAIKFQDEQYGIAGLEWKKYAAAQGNAKHQYSYASSIGFPIQPWEHYLTTEEKIKREHDLKEAFVLFEKAANQGHIESQRQLAQYYLHGFGCEKNLNEALHWALQVYTYEDENGGKTYAATDIGEIYMEMERPDLAVPYLERRAIYGDPRATELWHKARKLLKQRQNAAQTEH